MKNTKITKKCKKHQICQNALKIREQGIYKGKPRDLKKHQKHPKMAKKYQNHGYRQKHQKHPKMAKKHQKSPKMAKNAKNAKVSILGGPPGGPPGPEKKVVTK